MREQLLLHRQEAVLDRFVLPQEGPAHPPVLVQGMLFGAFQFEVGNPVVSASDIAQFGFHCHTSFVANLILRVAYLISYKNICLLIISRRG